MADGDLSPRRVRGKLSLEPPTAVLGLPLIVVRLFDVVEVVRCLTRTFAVVLVLVLIVRVVVGLVPQGVTDLVSATMLVALFLAAVQGAVRLVVDLVVILILDAHTEIR